MAHVWQLQEARNKLSQMVEEAISHGPQVITKRGVEAVVVLSYADYREIILHQKPLSVFFQESPLAEETLDLSRHKQPPEQDTA
jgi:antitoxin Phd